MDALRAAALLLCIVSVATGAQSHMLKPGDGVRVEIPRRITGTLVSADSAKLTIGVEKEASALDLPWSSVTRLQRSEPRTRAAGAVHRGTWGLGIGAAFAAAVLANPQPDDGLSPPTSELAFATLMSGVLYGAVIGALWPGRRWRDLDVRSARTSAAMASRSMESTQPSRSQIKELHEAELEQVLRETPALEATFGVSAPRSQYAQFPGLHGALALKAGFKPRLGAALVGEANAEIMRTGLMGGARLYTRNESLLPGRRTMTVFGQLLGGKMRRERSGLVEGSGGFAWQPGVGIDYGTGYVVGRLQFDYAMVRDGFVFDDRVTTGPVDELSGLRALVGATIRFPGW